MITKSRFLRMFGAAILLLLVVFCIPTPVRADTFVVNTPDDSDDSSCDTNHCSLREAINAANANIGPDTISFSALDATGGDVTITLNSLLPPVMDNTTTIDGTTVQGYSGEPLINVVKGVNSLLHAFALQSDGNVVRGFSLPGYGIFPQGQNPDPWTYLGGSIEVAGSGNLIEHNTLGWGAWPSAVGVRVDGSGNTISSNVISGNGLGILLFGPGQVIFGNFIGTDAAGTTAIPNSYGIYDHAESGGGHVIGGPSTGQRNIISGNLRTGVYLNSDGNSVQGNYIGTNAAGNAAIYNWTGISDQGENNVIGGSNPGEGNLISGNSRGYAGGSSSTQLFGNIIGADAGGTAPIQNMHGVKPGPGLVVGGLNPGEGNLFLGNGNGMEIDYGGHVLVLGNTFTRNLYGIDNEIDYTSHVTISQNSFFNNTEKGISLAGTNYDYPNPPDLDHFQDGILDGTTCSSCEVEIFLADPHPSGFGEGKTYVTTITAQQSGYFSEPVTLPQTNMVCQLITATGTNPEGYTSEFSQNIMANCIVLEPPWLYPLWTFITGLFVALVFLLRKVLPWKPGLLLTLGIGLGIAAGGGLLLLLNQLPGVVVNFSPEEQVLYSNPLPDCDNYLLSDGFSPANGSVLQPVEDLELSWTFSENLPEAEIRWMVSLGTLAGGDPAELVAANHHADLSSFGFSALRPESYQWYATGRQLQPDGETWLPFCMPGERLTFQILPAEEEVEPEEEEEIVEEPTAAPTEEPAPAEVPEDCEATVTALQDLNCRLGPGTAFQNVGTLLQGESALVDGQNSAGTWVWILNPDALGHCWVWREGVEEVCMPDRLQIIAEPTPEPESACRSDLSRSECGDAGGVYDPGADPPVCNCP
ncbi:MAG: CSLREA domain-containing protein [Anaerolineales bacterium]|nr:CSLREA domain-containing protein [Anaerolineales bacterium]